MANPLNAHQTLRRRLLWVGVITAMLVGVLTWLTESEKIDERVMALATHTAQRVSPQNLDAYASGRMTLAELELVIQDVATDHFGIIELYGPDKERILEYVPPALDKLEEELKRGGHIPLTSEASYLKRMVAGHFALVVAVPIARAGAAPSGYLEGVYLPDDATMGQIRMDVIRTVGLVVAAIMLTTLVTYPVVMALHREVTARTRSILRGNLELLQVLGGAIAQRDSDTNVHNYRVTLYALALAQAIKLPDSMMRGLVAGAFLHDAGKIGISDTILLKPGKLTAEEFQIMKTHVALGIEILKHSEWLLQARDVVAYHHEKYDGSGYMEGLSGEAIPLNARIFAVVDVFDALTSRRPYKEPMSPQRALEIMERDAGSHFDPALLRVFAPLATDVHERFSQAGEESLRAQLMPLLERYFMEGA
ncbi:HD-GYP domain-containing protein [Azoarcus sp. L1K30]|uniref:HD-GYP domain-containing protein n=1 Tax=Azoarcus sp. L1K30 TaxID=2820277 RepID=UPI001B828C03|nr:HD-GYP domain-containing protein [Azoarcus sp. L1K30]MBR0564907.1 HD-GYP domain-containing protein [Azoarcus sp. L1K30]